MGPLEQRAPGEGRRVRVSLSKDRRMGGCARCRNKRNEHAR
jgi:hypothetical protein